MITRFVYSAEIYPPTDERGSHGKRLCRVCKKEVSGRRRTFCSDGCVEIYNKLSDWGAVRATVFERDKGICSLCSCDTVKLKRICNTLPYHVKMWFLAKMRFNNHVYDLWECDHINPVIEHGSAKSIDELRTLCHPCHKTETAKLQTRMKTSPLNHSSL